MSTQPIYLKNVKVHNLKGIDLTLQKNSLIVFTGVSGSGKSSLAFDTIYVEGQRRYIESLSHYARRHMGNLPRPDADLIEGIPPTIAIEQKTAIKNPRSTVGTITGIYDYLRVLFARVGTPHCPVSGERVRPQSTEQILSTIAHFSEGSQLIILAPHTRGKKGEFKDLFDGLIRKGFTRIRLDQNFVDLTEEILIERSQMHNIDLVIDRIVLKKDQRSRLTEAVSQALELGNGIMSVFDQTTKTETLFSQHAYAQKSLISYPPLEPRHFSFNHPLGMCEDCEGLGIVREFDLKLIIDGDRSIKEGCCCVAGQYTTVKWGNIYDNLARLYQFSLDTPWKQLAQSAKKIFLYGNKRKWTRMHFVHPQKKTGWIEYIRWRGVLREAKYRLEQAKSPAHRAKMEKLMDETVCLSCKGSRIQPYPSATQLGGKHIHDITSLTIEEAFLFFKELTLAPLETKIARNLLQEIQKRLSLLLDIGLDYLTLDRTAPTLSGGEAQRVRLASHIGSGLMGTAYILDEPSVGLHPRDQIKLIHTLKALRNQNNTVIVVEHDRETMDAADHIVDIGPKAGALGGEIVAQGSIDDLMTTPRSITGAYLSGKKSLSIPKKRRQHTNKKLTIQGAEHHNLKNITVHIPLEMFVVLTGVSGSGKSSLVTGILYPALVNSLHHADKKVGSHHSIEGIENLDKIIAIDQTPIGRTPRSNPSTYVKVFDAIRDLFTQLPESQIQGFKSGRFSFNVAEGSCPECHGMGMVCIDMDFMDDVWSTCPTCEGKRFDIQTLSILYRGKSIHDVLEMTVEEAFTFFQSIPFIQSKLRLLLNVGLGYIKLGQSSTTLSGGEAQRVKLARELIRPATGSTLYILDEPTTGLHLDDIAQLTDILQTLCQLGNSVLVIEHQIDLIKTADWIIDLGPGGGKHGGDIIATGTPEEIACLQTPTALALKKNSQQRKQAKIKNNKRAASHTIPIEVKGARQNNLKNISLHIPRHKISVCTGPSGSGKSSLLLDTLYAEGQRRYIDSLPPYVRQFIKQMPKPHFDKIEHLSPAIAIERKDHVGNPRSTVGTMTEIYDFLRLLYAHAGIAYCPETGEKIESIKSGDVVKDMMTLPERTTLYVMIPLSVTSKHSFEETKEKLIKRGFSHVRFNGIDYTLEDEIPYKAGRKNRFFLVIDRLRVRPGVEKRLLEAIEQATKMTRGSFIIATPDKELAFNLSFAVRSTGKSYPPLSFRTFAFNANEGMCPHCLGLGFQWGANMLCHTQVMNLSPTALMQKLCKEEWTCEAEALFLHYLDLEKIDPQTPLWQLPMKQLQLLLSGGLRQFSHRGLTVAWSGINAAFAKSAKSSNKKLRESVIPHLEPTVCVSCKGERLNALARRVEVNKMTIGSLCALPLNEAHAFIEALIAEKNPLLAEILKHINNRLRFLCDIGLGYLSLDRKAPSLSGGEAQRIHLARQLGSGLVGCLYVLDEPTIGLHPHNHTRLNTALKHLCNLGNTLLIASHSPLTLSIADYIFDFGPKSGKYGGEIIAEGTLSEIRNNARSLTGQYLSGKKHVNYVKTRRRSNKKLRIKNAKKHNLKNVTLDIPTPSLTCFTGLSGSGKSTLMHHVLKKGMQMHLASRSKKSNILFEGISIEGVNQFNKLITIDQNPIGLNSRADVSTYSDILTPLRQFYAQLLEARAHGLSPGHFSYNHPKGMCRTCLGLGFKTVYLQFLPSLKVTCDACKGNRLNPLSLEVTYKGKNLGQLLQLTIDEAISFLPPIPKLHHSFETMQKVGLGYLTLGQATTSLSHGEARRLRLARELSKRVTSSTLYLFDEPTIGLHIDDVVKLIPIFQALVERGNTLVIIEHNPLMLKNADHLIDIGLEAGEKGGGIVTFGTPEEVAKHPFSHTAKWLNMTNSGWTQGE